MMENYFLNEMKKNFEKKKPKLVFSSFMGAKNL